MLPLSQKSKSLKLGEDDLLVAELNTREPIHKTNASKNVLSTEELKTIVNDVKKLSNSSNMKSVMVSVNEERKRKKFYEKINIILDKFESIKMENDDDRLQTLFLFVMQAASDYLFDESKRDEICIKLLCRFAKNDETLTVNIMNIVKSKVKKPTWFRKNKHNVYRLGSFFLHGLCKTT